MTLLENLIQINADGVGGRESAAASGARRGRTVLQSRPVRGATPSPTWPSQPDYPARVPTHLWSRVSPKSRSCSSERRNHVSTVSETWAILVERNREIPEWETSCRSNGTSLVRPRHGLASVRVTRCGCVCVGVCARATRSRRCFVDACLHRRSIKRWRRVEYFDTGRESILAQDASSARSQHPAQPPLFASRLHRPSPPAGNGHLSRVSASPGCSARCRCQRDSVGTASPLSPTLHDRSRQDRGMIGSSSKSSGFGPSGVSMIISRLTR